jgi:hypothetical protein
LKEKKFAHSEKKRFSSYFFEVDSKKSREKKNVHGDGAGKIFLSIHSSYVNYGAGLGGINS